MAHFNLSVQKNTAVKNADKIVIHEFTEYVTCFCGSKVELEQHHIAPRDIFGKDCDKYMIVTMCNVCHNKFHDTLQKYIDGEKAKVVAKPIIKEVIKEVLVSKSDYLSPNFKKEPVKKVKEKETVKIIKKIIKTNNKKK